MADCFESDQVVRGVDVEVLTVGVDMLLPGSLF